MVYGTQMKKDDMHKFPSVPQSGATRPAYVSALLSETGS